MLRIKQGLGLFTTKKILQGTLVMRLDVSYSRFGPLYDDFFGRHIRHSATPNCTVQGYSVIGLRTIHRDEELTVNQEKLI